MRYLFVLLLATSSLAAPHRRAVAPPPSSLPNASASWTVEIITAGGIAPGARTSIVLRSSGAATLLNGLGRVTCAGRITAAEGKRLGDLVAEARPEAWAASYALPSNPSGCCDQIRTTVRLTRGGQTSETFWFDVHPPLPADLSSLYETAFGEDSPRRRLETSCAGDPTLNSWSIEAAEEGGFAYRYLRLTLDSSGEIVVQPNPWPASCRFTIDGAELQELADMVRGADAMAWAASYARAENPDGCCDQLLDTVRLTRREVGTNGMPLQVTYTTHWFSDHPPLPADLESLFNRIVGSGLDRTALFQRFGGLCRP